MDISENLTESQYTSFDKEDKTSEIIVKQERKYYPNLFAQVVSYETRSEKNLSKIRYFLVIKI